MNARFLALVLVLGPVFAEPPAAQSEAPSPVPSTSSSPVSEHITGETRKLVSQLLRSTDERALPLLVELLSWDDEPTQAKICLGLIDHWPDWAVVIFREVLASDNATARRAVAHALGHVRTEDPLPLIVPLLSDPNPGVREGADYALWQRTADARRAARGVALGTLTAIPCDARARAAAARSVVGAELDRDQALPVEVIETARRLADSTLAERLMDRSRRADGDTTLAQLLRRMQRANRMWLGAPEPADVAAISYRLTRTELATGEVDEERISVPADAVDLMRLASVQIQRGARLELPIDQLMIAPTLTAPRLLTRRDGEIDLAYRTVDGVDTRIALGVASGYRSPVTLKNVQEIVSTVDIERAVPVREVLRDPEGLTLATTAYAEYSLLRGDALVPLEIVVATTGPAPRRYVLRYQVVDGVWLPLSSSVSEVANGASEVSFEAIIEDLTVAPLVLR